VRSQKVNNPKRFCLNRYLFHVSYAKRDGTVTLVDIIS